MIRLPTLVLFVSAVLPGAVIIDRIAVIAGSHAIKLSDIQRDLRLTEFMNREPQNLSPAEMRKSAGRLVDQTIIRDEIARGGYRRPGDADASHLVGQLVKDRFAGSDNKLRETLSQYSLTEDDLRQQLSWQLTVLRFIDQRFRPGIQVSDEDSRTYYSQHLSDLQRDYPRNYSYEALQPKITATIEGERVNQVFTDWLDQQRKRIRIEYREAAFQ